jgi:ubiquinone/menaquinone biosynthesis C-methylase UbiE
LALINPLQAILWTFRRNENDVVNLYNSLSPVMQLTTGGDMLNFGYWDGARTPAAAQRNLCSLVGDIAGLGSASSLVDVGSGLSAPAAKWKSDHGKLFISCVNINYRQLLSASGSINSSDGISLVNATSTALPFADQSADRVIALESAQHFRPLDRFVKECRRILKPGGALVIAMPVTTRRQASHLRELFTLGLLSFTWSSEHYELGRVKSAIAENGFHISEVRLVGNQVYGPLTDYYVENRQELRQKVLEEYSSFVERVLYKSLLKMKDVSKKGVIDYAIIHAS